MRNQRNTSENLLNEIKEISSERNMSLIETIVEICENNGYDVGEYVSSFDNHFKEILRQEALANNMLRKRCIPKDMRSQRLVFE